MDTDSYEDIYAEMRERCEVLANQGHKGYIIPVGGSTALGSIGYAECVRELAEQAKEARPRPQVWAWIPTPLRRSYPNW
ncbi:MAG: hypothetical protein KHW60_05490 [Oscillibacter sp.]|nr:hypothetical protein [Oscillibacter sp.]